MRFTDELLDFARWITSERYPEFTGAIYGECLALAIWAFRSFGIPTLIED